MLQMFALVLFSNLSAVMSCLCIRFLFHWSSGCDQQAAKNGSWRDRAVADVYKHLECTNWQGAKCNLYPVLVMPLSPCLRPENNWRQFFGGGGGLPVAKAHTPQLPGQTQWHGRPSAPPASPPRWLLLCRSRHPPAHPSYHAWPPRLMRTVSNSMSRRTPLNIIVMAKLACGQICQQDIAFNETSCPL